MSSSASVDDSECDCVSRQEAKNRATLCERTPVKQPCYTALEHSDTSYDPTTEVTLKQLCWLDLILDD